CPYLELRVLLVRPLLALSTSIYVLLPSALASWALALGVCAVAAAQAELPKKKRRTLSRPLVALLFFLQPIVRGWARYEERLTARSEPPVFKRSVASEPIDDWDTFGRVAYWSESGGDRYGLLNSILAKLPSEGWHHKTDTGWRAYEVEKHRLLLWIAALLDEIGAEQKLVKIRQRPPDPVRT